MNFAPYNKVENSGVSLHVEYDLGFATLTSITADRETTWNQISTLTLAPLINENFVNYDFRPLLRKFV